MVVGPGVYIGGFRGRGPNPLRCNDSLEARSAMCTGRHPAYTGALPMFTSRSPDCRAPRRPATRPDSRRCRPATGADPGRPPGGFRPGPVPQTVVADLRTRPGEAGRQRFQSFRKSESVAARFRAGRETGDCGPTPDPNPAALAPPSERTFRYTPMLAARKRQPQLSAQLDHAAFHRASDRRHRPAGGAALVCPPASEPQAAPDEPADDRTDSPLATAQSGIEPDARRTGTGCLDARGGRFAPGSGTGTAGIPRRSAERDAGLPA